MVRWIILPLLALVLAGVVFTQWRSQWSERRFPAHGRFFEHPAARIHYTDRGQGSTIILLHGASTQLRDFFAIEPGLSARYRVICVDRPGSGYSEYRQRDWLDPAQQAAIVLALMDALEIDQAVWAGHSLAGSVVMAGLLEAPRRVRGGILLAGAAYPWEGGVDLIDHLPGYWLIGPLLTHALIAPAGHLFLQPGLQSAFAPERPTGDYRQRSGIDLYLRPRQFAATARDIRSLSEFLQGQSRRYDQLTQPLLLIHGDADDIVPAWNHADRLIRIRPDARYHVIEGGGHQPHHVHAERVVRWIDQFMQEDL